jgi:CHASE3 domain sensor protein
MGAKIFDLIVISSFLILLTLTMGMWVNYDKLEKRIQDQNNVVRSLMITNNDLYVDNENLKHQLLDCRTLYKEY